MAFGANSANPLFYRFTITPKPQRRKIDLREYHHPNYFSRLLPENCNESWYCIEYCSTIFHFNSLPSNKNFLTCCTSTDSNITQWWDLGNDHNNSLSLKPSQNLKLYVNQFNNAFPENSNDLKKNDPRITKQVSIRRLYPSLHC